MRNKKCYNGRTSILVAFGVGMIVAYFCPSGFIVVMLTIALIILGLASFRI